MFSFSQEEKNKLQYNNPSIDELSRRIKEYKKTGKFTYNDNGVIKEIQKKYYIRTITIRHRDGRVEIKKERLDENRNKICDL